jgi:hypothetical protein
MLDLFGRDEETAIRAGRKLAARAAGLYVAPFDHFQTRAVDHLDLGFHGIEGDFHSGATRRSGGREPWYARGTEIRNERQVSIVAPDELAKIARGMEIAEVRPEWLGANLVIEGVPNLSMLPPSTMLFFRGGVTIKIDGQNTPCKLAGRAVAEGARMPDHMAGALAFPKVARRLRGLVGWVEKPGRIEVGEDISVRVPEQWIYEA